MRRSNLILFITAALTALSSCGPMGIEAGLPPSNGGLKANVDLSCNIIPDDLTKPGTVWIYSGNRRYLANVPIPDLQPTSQSMANVTLASNQNIKLGSFLSSFNDAGAMQYSGSGAGQTVAVSREYTNPTRQLIAIDRYDTMKAAISNWLGSHTLPQGASIIWISDIVVADATTYKVSKSGGFGLDVQQGIKSLKWDSIGLAFVGGNHMTIGPQDFLKTKGKPYTVCAQANELKLSSGQAAGGVALTTVRLSEDRAADFGFAAIDTTTYH